MSNKENTKKVMVFTVVYNKDLKSIKEKGLLVNVKEKNFQESDNFIYGCTKFLSSAGWEQKLIMEGLDNNLDELECTFLVYHVSENNISKDNVYYGQLLEQYQDELEELTGYSEEDYLKQYQTEEDYMSSLKFPFSEIKIDIDIAPDNIYYIKEKFDSKYILEEDSERLIFLYELSEDDKVYQDGYKYCYGLLNKI